MNQYQIGTNTRRCVATGRELRPGERYFSALFADGGKLERRDYAADAWPGRPDGAVGFWAGKVAPAGPSKRPPLDDDALFDCFAQLGEGVGPEQVRVRYVLALLLMRRKRLRFEEVRRAGADEFVVLRDGKGGRHEVLDPRLSGPEVADVQDEVTRVLGWD